MSPRSLDPISRRPDKPDGKSGASASGASKQSDKIGLPHTADRDRILAKAQATIQVRKNKKAASRRKWIATGMVVLVVGFIIGGFALQRRQAQEVKKAEIQKKNALNNKACSQDSEYLTQARSQVNSQNWQKIQPTVESAKKRENYMLDQNCLAPIAWQALMRGDFVQARDTTERIRSVYDPKYRMTAVNDLYTSDPVIIAKYTDDIERRTEKVIRQQKEWNQ